MKGWYRLTASFVVYKCTQSSKVRGLTVMSLREIELETL